jgi:hypothetical protein
MVPPVITTVTGTTFVFCTATVEAGTAGAAIVDPGQLTVTSDVSTNLLSAMSDPYLVAQAGDVGQRLTRVLADRLPRVCAGQVSA